MDIHSAVFENNISKAAFMYIFFLVASVWWKSWNIGGILREFCVENFAKQVRMLKGNFLVRLELSIISTLSKGDNSIFITRYMRNFMLM